MLHVSCRLSSYATVVRQFPRNNNISLEPYRDRASNEKVEMRLERFPIEGLAPRENEASEKRFGKLPEARSSNQPSFIGSQQEIPVHDSLDVAMGLLTGQLTQSLTIQDKPTRAARMVEVPIGYKLASDTTPKLFYELRGACQRKDKRKRAPGTTPKTRTKERYGFRPEELLWYGAIQLPNAKPSNLTNELHPFFHHSHFDDCADAIYEQLVPGLRLATMFLTQPVCAQFWATVAKGERKLDHEMTVKMNRSCWRISKDVPVTQKSAIEIFEYIKSLNNAQMLHFTFAKALELPQKGPCWAITKHVHDYKAEISKGLRFQITRSHIRLHTDLYTGANKLSQLRFPDQAQKLRFNLLVAIHIVHETAHALNLAHHRNRKSDPDWYSENLGEPFLLDHPDAELGNCWEQYVFGGLIKPINNRIDCSHGLSIYTWPVGMEHFDTERMILYSISMDYIESLQQMKTWQQDFDRVDTKVFRVPRDGAVSIYLNHFTTMPRSEERRVCEEELAEILAEEAAGPANKRREVWNGKAVANNASGKLIKSTERQPRKSEVPLMLTTDSPSPQGSSRLEDYSSQRSGLQGRKIRKAKLPKGQKAKRLRVRKMEWQRERAAKRKAAERENPVGRRRSI